MVTVRNPLSALRNRVDQIGHALGRRYREPSRIEQVGWPDVSADDLRAAARELVGVPGCTAVGDWLCDVAQAGNGYLKPSVYTLADIEEMRAKLRGNCCAGGPQWGHAWDCPTLP